MYWHKQILCLSLGAFDCCKTISVKIRLLLKRFGAFGSNRKTHTLRMVGASPVAIGAYLSYYITANNKKMFNYACTTKSGWNNVLGRASIVCLWWCECLAFTLIELDLLNEAISISRNAEQWKCGSESERKRAIDWVRPLFYVKNRLLAIVTFRQIQTAHRLCRVFFVRSPWYAVVLLEFGTNICYHWLSTSTRTQHIKRRLLKWAHINQHQKFKSQNK